MKPRAQQVGFIWLLAEEDKERDSPQRPPEGTNYAHAQILAQSDPSPEQSESR